MQLTTAQLQTLKTDLDANFLGVPDEEAAAAYNLLAAPDYFVWWSAVPIESILDQLTYTNYTPNDDPNEPTALEAAVWENRAMLVQIKQINLQLMLQGRRTFDATRTKQRNGLQDATENLPTGNNGNARTGGWATIQPVLSRKATRGEKLYASGVGSQATPAALGTGADGLELAGEITATNVSEARNLV